MTSPISRSRRLVAAAAALTATALVITGCTSGGGDEDAPDTLYILSTDTTIGWDPATNVNFPSTWNGLIARRLTTWKVTDSGVEVVPDLATDTGTPSDDGTTWTYTLKDDIFFEDGTPITSADIKYGIERSYSPDLAGGLHYHNAIIVGGSEYTGPFDGAELEGIETPDDTTIVFHLTTAYGDWPWIAATNPFAPVPVGEGTDLAAYDEDPVASGPYQIDSNVAGSETVLVRNEYWKQETDEVRTAQPDTIVIRQSQNPSTTAQALISDTGDAATSINAYPLSASELALVNADPAAQERLVTSDGGVLYYVALNNDSEELSNPLVRQAVHYATDRNAIVLAQGGDQAAVAATTLIPDGIAGHEDFDLYPEDVDKAKELLAEAGYPDGVTLDLWVANEDTAAAEALQQGLARADITVNINPLDIGVMYGDAMGGNPDYDMMLTYWIGDYPSANAYVSLMFDSSYIDGGYNLSRTNDPSVDTALHEAIAETDPDTAAADWTAIDKQIMGLGSMLPLYLTRNSYLAGSDVEPFAVPAYPPYPDFTTLSLAG
ncbi:ABC transporter substrate-binding protein [Homoserinibacter sp. GY 40078]|uniref:ABC transporter substrate-binding protein n=1 Tax=Homoserinibacter sp. GY 40078 TaxID=2603275 RepID=UPI0011CBCA6F|nr:ABC transporter substrate-binding protein [Homoserinibacter sp. GY 40078]TXK18865.1 ABC transporter substrate-binding protein [Homoserinibacter sp. GY 40078]